jgi:ribosomal protein S6--L-glutamate ligase
MRIAILSAGSGWHVRDLARAAGALNHEAVPVDFRRVHASPSSGGGPLTSFDAVVVRTMPPGSLEQVVFRMNLLHEFASSGKRVINPPAAIEACVDKYLTTARLARAGIPVPPTAVCQDTEAALEAFAVLDSDVIVKPLFGSEGRGMVRVTDPDLAWRTFKTLERLQSVIYLQRFIDHPGWDLRAFVIAGQVVAAMRRRASKSWRTNVAQGGCAEPVTLTVDEQALAVRAARAVGALVAGVDLLPDRQGNLFVLEVNAVPGWRALAPTTGIDIANLVVQELK